MSEPQVSETTRWMYVTDKANFDTIKSDEKFAHLVILGRALNALRSVQMLLQLSDEEDTSPAAMRERLNSLFLSCAIFCECNLLVQAMNKHFGGMSAFEKLKGVTTKSPTARWLLNPGPNPGLTSFRNQFVFHFEPEAMRKQLQTTECEKRILKPIFITGMGTSNSQVHYELSDVCALSALFDSSTDTEGALEKQIVEVIESFTREADIFMLAALTEYGWHCELASS